MDATRRFPPADGGAALAALQAAVAGSIAAALPGGGRVAVALSGGRDSVALLDAALAAAPSANCTIVAFHVDHGLSTNAAAWARFCGALCAARGIACETRRVVVERLPRTSVEAAARRARYEALAALAREHAIAAVLLAHHADDQAETTLLQLLRGAGPRGLAAMPAARVDEGVWWLRPLLALPRSCIDAYVAARALRHVDDESNADTRYRRNALRSAVVPALRTLAPGYPATLARAAELQADAATLLDDLARLDAGHAYDGRTLDCTLFATLDARRSANVLRWFLREQRLPAPSRARLAEALRQLQRQGDDSRIAIGHAGTVLGVHRRRLVVHRRPLEPYSVAWDNAERWVMSHGTLSFAIVAGAGVAMRHVAATRVTVRSGVDGERLRMPGRHVRRNVADLLREAGIPAWDRQAVPRIYCDDVLAAVTAVGADAAFAAEPGEPGGAWQWQPNAGCT